MLLQYLFRTIFVPNYRLFLRSGRSEISCEKIIMDACHPLFDFWYWHPWFRFTWYERYQPCGAFLNCDICSDIPCCHLLLHLEHCERHQSIFRINNIGEKNGSVVDQNRFFVYFYAGIWISIVVPFPTLLRIVMSPPCLTIISFAMAIPRPEPACETPVFVPL